MTVSQVRWIGALAGALWAWPLWRLPDSWLGQDLALLLGLPLLALTMAVDRVVSLFLGRYSGGVDLILVPSVHPVSSVIASLLVVGMLALFGAVALTLAARLGVPARVLMALAIGAPLACGALAERAAAQQRSQETAAIQATRARDADRAAQSMEQAQRLYSVQAVTCSLASSALAIEVEICGETAGEYKLAVEVSMGYPSGRWTFDRAVAVDGGDCQRIGLELPFALIFERFRASLRGPVGRGVSAQTTFTATARLTPPSGLLQGMVSHPLALSRPKTGTLQTDIWIDAAGADRIEPARVLR